MANKEVVVAVVKRLEAGPFMHTEMVNKQAGVQNFSSGLSNFRLWWSCEKKYVQQEKGYS